MAEPVHQPIYRFNDWPEHTVSSTKILVIDNYDSFVYTLVGYLQELGAETAVYRNDDLSVEEATKLAADYDGVLISPGPGEPAGAGVSIDLIKWCGAQRKPMLGVCLGHQAIGQAYGGDVVRAKTIMHGKTSRIRHEGQGVFAGLPDGYEATRYHSLVVRRGTLPDCLEITAWTDNDDGSFDEPVFDEIMGLRHREHPVEGVQFHPESILTEHGHALLKNFLER